MEFGNVGGFLITARQDEVDRIIDDSPSVNNAMSVDITSDELLQWKEFVALLSELPSVSVVETVYELDDNDQLRYNGLLIYCSQEDYDKMVDFFVANNFTDWSM